MATTEAEAAIISELKNIRTSLEQGGDGGVTSQTFKELNTSIQDTIRSQRDAEEQQKQINRETEFYRKSLRKLGGTYSQTIAAQIKSSDDVVRMQRRLSDDSLEQFQQIKQARENELISVTEADDRLEQLGFTSADLKKTMAELREESNALERATEQFRHKMDGGVLGSVTRFAAKATAAAGALAAIIRPAINVAQSAARTGTQMEVLDAALMGMSPEELNQLQAEHRRIIQASGLTLDEFNETISSGASSMITYTGSLRDAIRINAESMNMAKVLGTNQEQFMKDQEKRFKGLNRSISMTAEQFMEMNKQLMDSTAVQSQLYRINVKQRAAYIQDLQNTYEKLTLDGLTHEQAMKMLETFEQIGAKSPRERLKEAAKLQAVMGAMGMGGAGAEAAGLLRGGLRGEGEKERFADIMKNANVALGETMGQGFASEMMAMQMIQTAGLDQYLGPGSEFATFNIRQAAQIDETVHEAQKQTKLGEGANKLLEAIMHSSDVIANAATGPIGQTLTAILAGIGALQLATGIGGLGGLGAGAKLAGAGKLALRAAGGVGLAAGAGYAAGTGIYKGMEKVTPEAHSWVIDNVGKVMTDVFAAFGSKEAQETKRMVEEQEKARMEAAERAKAQEELTREHIRATKEAKSAVENQTEQQKKMAEEQSKSSGKGYRVMWTRAPRMTSQ